MAKTDNRPKEKMRLTIEFADNGIILRNPDCEDEVTLAVRDEHDDCIDHSDECKAIGMKVYNWMMDVILPEYENEIIATGAELDIMATLTGRRM
jgi:hypothetical protein